MGSQPSLAETDSPAQYLADLPIKRREALLAGMGPEALGHVNYNWPFWARPKQLPPEGDWFIWLMLGGRRSGKTRAGAEWVRKMANEKPGSRGALVAPTPGDARDVMIDGESGIMAVCPPGNQPEYEPSNRRLTWKNGSIATVYSAFEPGHLRGPGHDWAWADELAVWKRLAKATDETAARFDNPWHNLMISLSRGDKPRCVVTTTPKPIPLIRELASGRVTGPDTASRKLRVVVTRSTTYENLPNLAPVYQEQVLSAYEGTTLARQEIYAEILEEVEDALWKQVQIGNDRVADHPELVRVVTAIDPSGGVGEIGIVTGGLGEDGHGYVLEDSTLRASPLAWATAAITDYNKFGADRIIGERNFGGDMVASNIETAAKELKQVVSYKDVTAIASRGKKVRAEPIAALYEQGRIHHVGTFPALEGELTSWVPGDASPNRLDALVWAMTELMMGKRHEKGFYGFLP